MLYNKNLLNKSYETSREIVQKMNEYWSKKLKTNEEIKTTITYSVNDNENFKNDGQMILSYCDKDLRIHKIKFQNVEYKQRQNYYIRDVIDKKKEKYENVTIQKSTVDCGNSDLFVIYDKSMNCYMEFGREDIDKSKIVKRWEHTELGPREISYYTIDDKRIKYFDLTK